MQERSALPTSAATRLEPPQGRAFCSTRSFSSTTRLFLLPRRFSTEDWIGLRTRDELVVTRIDRLARSIGFFGVPRSMSFCACASRYLWAAFFFTGSSGHIPHDVYHSGHFSLALSRAGGQSFGLMAALFLRSAC